MATPAAPIGGMDVRADIAATLSASDPAPLQSGADSIPAAPSEPAAAPPVQKAPDAVPNAPAAPQGQTTPPEDEFSIDFDKEPTEQEPEGQPESQEPGTAEAKPGDPDAEIGALLATSRGKRIYADFKKGQQLAKLPDEGGIGHNPTAEQVTDYFHAYTDRQNMQHDFSAGVPEAAQAWADYWFGPDNNGAFRDGSAQVAAQLPEFLASKNQDAYVALANPILDKYAKAALGRFAEAMNSTTDATERERWWAAAACLHKDLYGEWPDPATFTGQPQQTVQKQPDRNTDEVTRLREENARLRQSEQTQRQQAIGKQIDTRIDAALYADVDTALKVVKDALDPVLYTDAREQFASKVKAALAKDRDSERLFQVRRNNAIKRGDDAEMAALVKHYRQRAFNVITELRKGYIKAAGVKAVEKSTERHAQLQQSSQKVAPAAGGAPIQTDLKQAFMEQKPGESHGEWVRRTSKHLMSSVA